MITQQVFVVPCAVTVGLPVEHIAVCQEILGQAGLRVHCEEHVVIACERITKLLPQVVVMSTALRGDVRTMIEDRAVAVGAVLASIEPTVDASSVERDLRAAVATVRQLLGRSKKS